MEIQNGYVEVKVKSNKVAIFAIIISGISLLLSAYTTFRPFDKEKINVKNHDELTIERYEGNTCINQFVSFRNYGKSAGVISSIDALIVSKSTDPQGNSYYKRHFSDVWHLSSEKILYPFLNWIIYPHEAWTLTNA